MARSCAGPTPSTFETEGGDDVTDEFLVTSQVEGLSTHPLRARNRYGEDDLSSLVLYNYATHAWHILVNPSEAYPTGERIIPFGFPGARPVGRDVAHEVDWELGLYHPPTSTWYTQNPVGQPRVRVQRFGAWGMIPVPEDYDGDGKADRAVYDPYRAVWSVLTDAGVEHQQFGYDGVTPVPRDYDADGKTDWAVFDAETGRWFLDQSYEGFRTEQFGFRGVVPVPEDYDGDQFTDLAVYAPASARWFIRFHTGEIRIQQFGYLGAIPVPGDYDGDGVVDLAVYDPEVGEWYILESAANTLRTEEWGGPMMFPEMPPWRRFPR